MRPRVRRRPAPRFAILLSLTAASALCLFALLIPAQAATANHIVISEVQITGDGTNSSTDEFIELYNPTSTPIVMSGWRINRHTSTGSLANVVPSLNGTIPAYGFFLVAHPNYNGNITPDVVYASSNSISADNAIILYSDNEVTVVDSVGMGVSTYGEGTATVNPPANGSIERKPGASDPTGGNGEDTDSNAGDFATRTTSDPQNSSSALEPPNTSTPTNTDTSTSTSTSTQTVTPTPSDTPTPSGTPTNSPTPTSTSTPAPDVIVINEVVTDPQKDWNDSTGGDGVQFNATPGDGTITDTDEWIELYNAGMTAINLQSGSGWTLSITDSGTDTINFLSSTGTSVFVFSGGGSLTNFQPGEYLVIGNPPGSMNNDVYLALRNPSSTLIDDVEIGNVSSVGTTTDGAPDGVGDGNATSASDEAIARAPNAADTNNHVTDFEKQQSTIGATNNLPATATPTATSTSTSTATSTPTPTHTQTPTPTSTPTAFAPLSIVINEVMWMGSSADSNDEWIELYNNTGAAINLTGWTLTIDDGVLPDDTVINLSGTIAAGGFFLLERTADDTVSDITADFIYTGSMNNEGRVLTLRDHTATVIDTANGNGGAWPAGDDSLHASMERISTGAADSDSVWVTNYGHVINGRDKNGGALRATPRQPNSALFPTPTPTAFARYTTIRLNEILPNPSKDWSEYYGPNIRSPEEFIELYNTGGDPVDISYWMIDDKIGDSSPYVFPPGSFIDPGQYYVIYKSTSGISLNDDEDSARLLYPDGTVVDEVSWNRSMKDDYSISRDVAGTGTWQFDWMPTPGMGNRPHPNRGPKPTPAIVGIRLARTFGDGAWVTLVGRVTGPYPLFGSRLIYMQDESGAGIALYLGRGTWPPMQAGQSITAAGYLRTRNGERELYVKNGWLFSLGDPGPVPTPVLLHTGEIGEDSEGTLVTIAGKVVRLEANAFWIDDGSGAARIFFRSSIGFERPKLRRGQIWLATGIVGEYTSRSSRFKGYRILVRFETDLFRLGGDGVEIDLTPTATALEDETATPTLLPQATDTPEPARAP